MDSVFESLSSVLLKGELAMSRLVIFMLLVLVFTLCLTAGFVTESAKVVDSADGTVVGSENHFWGMSIPIVVTLGVIILGVAILRGAISEVLQKVKTTVPLRRNTKE